MAKPMKTLEYYHPVIRFLTKICIDYLDQFLRKTCQVCLHEGYAKGNFKANEPVADKLVSGHSIASVFSHGGFLK